MFENTAPCPPVAPLDRRQRRADTERYFDVTDVLQAAADSPSDWTSAELRDALLDTLKHHLVADVPVELFCQRVSSTIVGLTSKSKPTR